MIKQVLISIISAFTGVGTVRASYFHMIEPAIKDSIESFFTVAGVIFGSLLSMILCVYWAIKLIQLIKNVLSKKHV